MRFKLQGFLVMLTGTLLGGSACAQENYTQWSCYRDVIINTKASGANVATAQVNFPVLIRLTSTDSALFTTALAQGADVRFANAAGKHLAYQIEQWNTTALTAAIWVLADTVKGNDSSAAIRMYWGKAGSADSSKSAAVFDTGAGFQAVWHLNEVGNADSVGYADATKNLIKAIGVGTAPGTDTVGMIGTGQSLNGSSQYLTVSTTGISGAALRTISGWVKGNSATSARPTAFGYNPNTTTNFSYFDFTGNGTASNYYMLYVRGSGSDITSSVSTSDVTWHYFAAAYDGTSASLYVDGALAGNTTFTAATIDSFVMGFNPRYTTYFQGILDEIRIDHVARDANWVALCYQNQQTAQTLVSLGAIVTIPISIIPKSALFNQGVLGSSGIMAIYSLNGRQIAAIPFDASATKSALVNSSMKNLAKGVYLYRITGSNANVIDQGRFSVESMMR
jgi:hypothetical protein